MIVGHYATALLPYGRGVKAPLWVFLMAANIADFLWLVLIFFGVEVPEPSSMLTATFNNIRVDMKYSHAVEPTLVMAAAVGLIVGLIFRNMRAAIWAGVLVVLHFVCDLLSGFGHEF